MVNPEGSFYDGDWINDEEDGYGIEKSPKGHEYLGQYSKGKKHGKVSY